MSCCMDVAGSCTLIVAGVCKLSTSRMFSPKFNAPCIFFSIAMFLLRWPITSTWLASTFASSAATKELTHCLIAFCLSKHYMKYTTMHSKMFVCSGDVTTDVLSLCLPLSLAVITAWLSCVLLLLDCDELSPSLTMGVACNGDLSLMLRSSSGTSNTALGILLRSPVISVLSVVDRNTCAAPVNQSLCSDVYMCVYMYICLAEQFRTNLLTQFTHASTFLRDSSLQ